MAFSSAAFLFVFMPAFFGLYFLTPAPGRNAAILVGSLLFYVVTGGVLTLVLVFSILVNHVMARRLVPGGGGRLLAVGIVCNLAPLAYFKYWPFLRGVAGDAAGLLGGHPGAQLAGWVLPAGISFYTFHGVSYLVDVYRGKVAPADRLVDFAMYMVNFPQLIAGPIVRYVEIAGSVRHRPLHIAQIYSGVLRFVAGLGKKMILADGVASIADRIFTLPAGELTTALAWLGAGAYALQIYYDFSGYSDMAIGMGRMMGFEFPENFNQPYRARSITEFWRRWHMTLSRWFRDYLYIPLGGNRAGPARTYVNLFVVFFLCGLWHGAAYTFIAWGLYHGMLLIVERILDDRFGFTARGPAGQAVALVLVVIGWVLFRARDLDHAGAYLATMLHLHRDGASMFGLAFYLTPDKVAVILAGTAFALLPFERLSGLAVRGWIAVPAQTVWMVLVLIYSASLVAANGFNPFIYFRF